MTKSHAPQIHPRPISHDAATHLFEIGQAVRLKGGLGRSRQLPQVYRITGVFPSSGDSPQYRIRSDEECYERVATQGDLESVGMPKSEPQSRKNATLIERTFDHGQEPKTQQPRNQKAEAGEGSA